MPSRRVIRSVTAIVPSRGRPERLRELLRRLADQRLGDGLTLDVVAVLDGDQWGGPPPDAGPHRVRLLELGHVGISAAKNAAVAHAAGDLLLLLNDDVEPEPGFVRAHADAHERGERIVLGRSPWVLPDRPTLLDRAIADTRMIFFYGDMRPGERYDFRYAWNLNLSVRRQDVAKLAGPFDERFRPCMWEDLEFAHRLLGDRAAVHFAADALAPHRHRYTWTGYLQREALLGVTAHVLWAVNPDCFLRVFRCDHSTLVARATAAIDLDTADAARTVAALRDAASTAAVSPEAVRLFYHAHLPLKRRAFRLGLLAAQDRPDRPWPERPALAAEALAADPIFASLHEAPPRPAH